jgi:hypothetical protein
METIFEKVQCICDLHIAKRAGGNLTISYRLHAQIKFLCGRVNGKLPEQTFNLFERILACSLNFIYSKLSQILSFLIHV